ncbi:Transmembrane emp24 domain-containing protein 9, partial [Nibea albiflora]
TLWTYDKRNTRDVEENLKTPSRHSSDQNQFWSPGEGRHREESEQELEAVEAEQDGAEDELQPQDERLQQQEDGVCQDEAVRAVGVRPPPCSSFVSSLYFHIGETEKKCFIEEIPDETMIIGNYRTQLYDKQREEYLPATQGLGMFVEVKDPDDKRVHLDIQVGEHANNYAEIAAKDKLTELQLRVRQLVEQVDQIQKEQNYQRVSQSVCV